MNCNFKTKHIVLIDVDKTLINPQYQLTDDITYTIKQIEKKSSVGLCSDSAIPSLQYWADKIGSHGYLVGELGAIVCHTHKDIPTVVINPTSTSWLIDLRNALITSIMQEWPHLTVLIGDSVKFIREKTLITQSTDITVFVNGLRQQSLSIHAGRFVDNNPVFSPDIKILRSIRCKIESLASKISTIPITIDENLEYGIIIVHATSTSKKHGVAQIIKQHADVQVFMVGDSLADYLKNLPVIHCAVANASDDFKAFCEYVSPFPYTKGVRDILAYIHKQLI